MAQHEPLIIRQAKVPQQDDRAPAASVYEFEIYDNANALSRTILLSVRLRLSPPFPNHPRAMELATLLRVRDLLTEQTEAMRSP